MGRGSIENTINPSELDGTCSSFALASAIYFFYPQQKEKVITFVNDLIKTPIEDTPMYNVYGRGELPAVISAEGASSIVDWIKEDYGDIVINFINQKLTEKNFSLTMGYLLRNKVSTNEILDLAKTQVVIPSCVVNRTNEEFEGYHHLAIGFRDSEYVVMDINSPSESISIPKERLGTLFDNEESRIQYHDSFLSFDSGPLLFVKQTQ